MKAEIKTAREILAFLKANPTWVLQHCNGVRFSNWWWLRKTATSTECIKVNGNAARSASKSLRIMPKKHAADDTSTFQYETKEAR